MINFVSHKMTPEVKCSCISEDDYPVTNLIESDMHKRDLGFMAFKVTKPPIEIDFTFLTEITIHTVKIWSTIGSLRSTGFEIYTEYKDKLIKVGQALNLITCDMVTFIRAQNPTTSSYLNADNIHIFFNSKFINTALDNTKFLRIVIKNTKNCPPVIRKIEIWGDPAKNVPALKRDDILRLWKKEEYFIGPSLYNEEEYYPFDSPPLHTNSEFDNKCENSKKRKWNTLEAEEEMLKDSTLPEEFVDCITYELLVVPMRLPSGKVVDQSTIERHNSNEEIWGRLPSDPFTGQLFTPDRKPVFDAALKARIDKFLIDNSDKEEFKNAPRMLGSITKLRINDQEKCKNDVNNGKIDKNEKLDQTKADHNNFSSSLHESTNNSNLKLAVKAAWENVTKFTATISQEPPEKNKKFLTDESYCIKCKDLKNLYKIGTCNHLACKNCIHTLTKAEKCLCSVSFKTSDVIKYYSSTVL